MLDPCTIINICTTVYELVRILVDAVDKTRNDSKYEDAQMNGALESLQQSLENLGKDTDMYKILLNHLLANEESSDLLATTDGEKALESMRSALTAAEDCLRKDWRPVSLQRYNRTEERKTLNALIESVKGQSKSLNLITLEVQAAQKAVEFCLLGIERAYKLLSNLYSLAKLPLSPPLLVRSSSLLEALDTAEDVFNHAPFAVLPRVNARFSVLNQSRHDAEQHVATMEALGRRFVDNSLSGRTGVTELGDVQLSVLNHVSHDVVDATFARLKDGTLFSGGNDKEKTAFEEDLYKLKVALEDVQTSRERAKFSIAFLGMVKAGKSLFLNALIGRSILPSEELPSTAWPCRVRHVKGQTEPRLEYDQSPFLLGIKLLREEKFGEKLQTYSPPSDDPFGDMCSDIEEAPPTEEETRLREIHAQWVNLHSQTKANLLQFEKDEFQLAKDATGDVAVTTLLSQLNDIVRLCNRFNLRFDMTNVEGPLVSVEFKCLRGRRVDGIYEFLDLPGIGEEFHAFDYETLIRLIAKDVNAMVPIISFKELSRSDWRNFPIIVKNGWGRQVTMVVCTHLDQIHGDNLTEQLTTITRVFWPSNVMDTSSIVACSSLMGLSAQMLLDCSTNDTKPPFEMISGRSSIMYHCAVRVLGTGSTQATYDPLTPAEWIGMLQNEIEGSGLLQGIDKLTKEIVYEAKQRTLLAEGRAIVTMLGNLAKILGRRLLEARRSRAEFDAAKKQYIHLRTQLEQALRDWDGQQKELQRTCSARLTKALSKLQQEAHKAVSTAIRKTLDDPQLGHENGLDNASTKQEQGVTVLTVPSKSTAEEFLRLSQQMLRQSLRELQQKFVQAIRNLADFARTGTFERLHKNDIQILLDAVINIGNDRTDILDGLDQELLNIRTLVYKKLRSQIKRDTIRYRPVTAFQALETNIAELFRSATLPPSDSECHTPTEKPSSENEDSHKATIEAVSFMVRAPLAALATLPFIFGSPIWPWVIQSRTYSLPMDVIEGRYREKIIKPWLATLETEAFKAVNGTICTSSDVAKNAVTDSIEREDERYQRELESMGTQVPPEQVQGMVAVQGSLIAAEAALWSIQLYLKECMKE